jgi:hypothetical protein
MNKCKAQVPFLYLSATGSEGLIKEILQEAATPFADGQQSSRHSVVCVGKEIIPPSHVYSGKCDGFVAMVNGQAGF